MNNKQEKEVKTNVALMLYVQIIILSRQVGKIAYFIAIKCKSESETSEISVNYDPLVQGATEM